MKKPTKKELINPVERALHQYHHQKRSIDEIAESEHKSIRTIYRWLQKGNSPKNNRQPHQSKKCHRVSRFSDEVLDRIVALKQENSKRSAKIILKILIQENYDHIPSETSIRRHLAKNGLGRVASEYRQGYIAFERACPNELWQIDIAGVQTIGHLGQLYLFALLDDCSRFIPAAFYSTDQKGSRVIQLLQQAITKYGRPKQMLADNGTQFKNILGNLGSKYERILQLLDIKPIFARVRHPQTKGKLERFFGTVKTMFIAEARYQVKQDPSYNLIKFNQSLQKWLEFYNTQHHHRGLPNRCSPNKIYFGKQNRIYRPLKVQIDWNKWIQESYKRKVMKSNTISFQGNHYEIPPGFAGLKVEVMLGFDSISIFRGDQCLIQYNVSPSSIILRKSQKRKISQSGTFGYQGRYYYLGYKMSGQQIQVKESADGAELLIYLQNKLIQRIKR